MPRWQLEAHGRTAQDFTNNWFVTFSWRLEGAKFDGTPLSRREHAVMLLDGTLAEERLSTNHLRNGRAALSGGFVTPTSEAVTHSPREPVEHRSADRPGSLAGLDDPSFQIPRMQWDPEQAPIPINLSEQSVRAYRQLEKQPGIPADLTLKEIWIGSYTPLAAIQAQKADIESNLHHWIVTFSFSALLTSK